MPDEMLSPDEIGFFKENGYLIVNDLVDPDTVANWQRTVATFFGFDPGASGDQVAPLSKEGLEKFHLDAADALSSQPKLVRLVRQLIGDNFTIGTEQLILKKAKPQQPWQMTPSGHIDLLYKASRLRFMLGVTFYAFEVQAGGGGFVFWPRSHKAIWEYFQASPADYYGGGAGGGLDWLRGQLNQRVTTEPIEFIGKPGTGLIWHSFLLHNGSMNVSKRHRFAIIGRWAQRLKPEETHEGFGDMWEHWAL